jgi:CheY-like chemotaxis protein
VTHPCILVVEDNPTTRKLFRVSLEAEGYRVLEAQDGRRALAAAAADPPDMALLDLVLPDMEGLALARALRESPGGRTMPIVAVSGFRRLLDRARLEPGAFDDVLVKPVNMAELLATVRAFVAAPEAPGKAAVDGAAPTILVVDDDPVQLKLTRLRLETMGLRVATAVDGAAALEQARAKVPDAVLCDVLMPGMDGYELCVAIRRDGVLSRVPVVLVSAHYGGARDEELAHRAGASALVTRTPDFGDAVKALHAAIAHPERPTQADLPSGEHAERVIEQLRRQARANAVSADRSALQAAQISILAGIAEAMARSDDVEEAFGDVLGACLDASGITQGAFYRIDDRDRLVFAHAIGFPDALRASVPSVFGHPELLDAAKEGRLVSPSAHLSEDVAARLLQRAGANSIVLVPLLRSKRCVGALLLASSVSQIGEQELLAFGRGIGAHVAQALAMTGAVGRLRQAAEASRMLNASLDLHETLDALGKLSTHSMADTCEIQLDGEALHVSGATGLPAAATRPAHRLTEELVAHGRILGTVTLTRSPERRAFDDGDRLFVDDLLQRASIAVDNALLFRAAQEANRLKDEFLGTVSHELRTPLNAILGWARMMAAGLSDERRAHAVDVIERNALAQTQLIEDLLDTSRIMSGKVRLELRPTEVSKVIDAALDAVQPAMALKGVRLLPRAQRPIRILADPDRLQQIVWNLLSNAIKFTPAGGHVGIEASRDDTHLTLCVRDDGEGIDAGFLPHVFERFKQADGSSTRAHGGLGLGLAITRHLVELHGGRIEASSDGGGHGATFVVRLPLGEGVHSGTALPDAPPAKARAAAFERPAELRGLAVLVVDDQEDTRDLIASVLEMCGARAICASSCGEALGVFEEGVPDVLLSDIGMPGQDGFTLIKTIRAMPRERGGDVPAAALTGFARVEDRDRAMRAGFQLHLPKPVDPAELVSVVANLSRLARV